MTTMQTDNAKALFQEIANLPERKQDKYITAMRMLLLGERLADQARSGQRQEETKDKTA